MDYRIINLKEHSPTVEQALAIFQINLDACRLEGVKVIKIIHGYGSHGVGGGICSSLRNKLKTMKKNGEIKDYLIGIEWDISNERCIRLLENLKDCYGDEDLGKQNPGITIVIL